MTSNKKYDYRVTQNKKTWTAEIIRRVTSKRTSVSKSQDGFSTEAEAKAWGEKELASFLDNLAERNKRDSAQRTEAQKEKAARDEAYKQRKKDSESLEAEGDEAEGDDSDDSNDSELKTGSEFSAWKKSGWDSTEE
jgi:hypothetical protein